MTGAEVTRPAVIEVSRAILCQILIRLMDPRLSGRRRRPRELSAPSGAVKCRFDVSVTFAWNINSAKRTRRLFLFSLSAPPIILRPQLPSFHLPTPLRPILGDCHPRR
jgi:hypothetical protein